MVLTLPSAIVGPPAKTVKRLEAKVPTTFVLCGLGGVKSPTAAVTSAKYSASRILSSFDEARLVLYGVVFPATCADWKKIKNFAQNAVKNA